MAKSNIYTEQWFLERGYIPDGRGGFDPPPVKSEYIRAVKGELIVKEPIVKTPDFTAKPVTEWYISGQVPSKKNCQQLYVKKLSNGKIIPGTTTSQRYKDYITATKNYWVVFGKEFNKTMLLLGLNWPVSIEFTFVRSTMQEVDYVGPLESVQDIMQDYGWLPNDDYKHLKPVLGDMEVDKNNPGVRIKLLTHGK
jgi:hypothetical protein